MRYRHYSPTDDLVGMQLIDFTPDQEMGMKPRGIWISDDTDYGWARWCREAEWGYDRLLYKYSIGLSKNARILYIRTVEELDAFTKKYRADDVANHCIAHIGEIPDTISIDWPAIAKQYQGIIITPYQWSRRLHMGCSWYYPWDCASGCIWDPEAIDYIARLKHTAPKEVAA